MIRQTPNLNIHDKTQANHEQVCENYLKQLYEGISGFIAYQGNEKQESEKEDVYLTYGEVTFPGISRLLQYAEVNSDDVFCDMGSGVGKVVMQAFLQTPAKHCYGVEASQTRHASATQALARLKQDFPDLFQTGRELTFLQGNFLKTDLSETTIVYAASTCYSDGLMEKMAQMINNSPAVRCVMSLKPVPCRLTLVDILEVEATWVSSTKCHVYRRID